MSKNIIDRGPARFLSSFPTGIQEVNRTRKLFFVLSVFKYLVSQTIPLVQPGPSYRTHRTSVFFGILLSWHHAHPLSTQKESTAFSTMGPIVPACIIFASLSSERRARAIRILKGTGESFWIGLSWVAAQIPEPSEDSAPSERLTNASLSDTAFLRKPH